MCRSCPSTRCARSGRSIVHPEPVEGCRSWRGGEGSGGWVLHSAARTISHCVQRTSFVVRASACFVVRALACQDRSRLKPAPQQARRMSICDLPWEWWRCQYARIRRGVTMPGMPRRRSTILAAVSLTLCLAVAGVFVRSFWIGDCWSRIRRDETSMTETKLWFAGGRFGAEWNRLRPETVNPYGSTLGVDRWRHRKERFWLRDHAWYGFTYDSSTRPRADVSYNFGYIWLHPLLGSTICAIPCWPFMLLLSIPPALWLRRFREHRRRQRLGLCLSCGYDLRATPDRCPECGMIPGKPETVSH